jgi:membrane protein YqaA with SNARE-associated domain
MLLWRTCMTLFRTMYDWVISWADRPGARPALFGIALAEASVLPVPPDPLLMALGFGIPKKAFYFALICTAGSVIGGGVGYLLGFAFQDVMTTILKFVVDGVAGHSVFLGSADAGPVIDEISNELVLFGSHTVYQNSLLWKVTQLYHENAFMAILGAAITPIPYKVFTVTAGYADISLPVFFAASILGRGARFFTISTLVYFFGPRIKSTIEQYFGWFTMAFFVLLVAGFLVIRYV